MFYRADGTSAYVTVMHVTGMLGGRRGSFVLQGHGAYDGTTARGQSHVVEGSGTANWPDRPAQARARPPTATTPSCPSL